MAAGAIHKLEVIDFITFVTNKGVKKHRKNKFELAPRLFPFYWLSHFQKHKAQLWTITGSAASKLELYTKEIPNNTKKNQETGYFSSWP